jgi:hypothetical protein
MIAYITNERRAKWFRVPHVSWTVNSSATMGTWNSEADVTDGLAKIGTATLHEPYRSNLHHFTILQRVSAVIDGKRYHGVASNSKCSVSLRLCKEKSK